MTGPLQPSTVPERRPVPAHRVAPATPTGPTRRPSPAPVVTAVERVGPGRRLVHVYAVLVMVLGTGAFVPLVEADTQSAIFTLWTIAYLVAVVGLIDDRFRHRRRIVLPPTLLLIVVLATASVLWSVAPDLTLRRSLGLAGTVLVGIYLARRLSALQIFDALRRAVLLVTVASLLLWATGSALAVDDVHGTLRGVLPTKNTLGRVVALGTLAAAAMVVMDPARRRRAAGSAVIMLAALALTASTGGMVMAALVMGVAATILLAAHPRGRIAVAGVAAVVLAAAVALLPGTSADEVTGVVGEDATLTGRTEIWDQALYALSLRPVFGYGYGAFWHKDFGAPEAQRIRAFLQWDVPSAHNGFLDLSLDLGIIGGLIGVVALASLVVRGILDVAARRVPLGALRLSVAGVTILANLAETGLFQLNNLYTVLLAVALAARPPTRHAAPGEPVRPMAAAQ